jgi:hypothetical protein
MGHIWFPRFLPWVFWIAACIAVPIWISVVAFGWDLNVYTRAIHSLQIGHDPYLDGIAEQQRVHVDGAPPSETNVSFSYVYPPVTLPALRLVGRLPGWCISAYWLLYIAGILAQILVCLKAGEGHEKYFLALFAPAAAFFPGLVQTATILCGNIAYILYGLVLLAALNGWRRGRWRWFYAAVLVAACFKPPYLTLLAIPVCSARKQWLPAALTGMAGMGVFAAQMRLWPVTFQHFLRAVEMQFSYNSDFGSSPAGNFGLILYLARLPYNTASWLFYLAYAVPVFLLLVLLSRRYFAGALTLEQWSPVLLCGTILLNPRVLEYDLAVVTVPMALIVFRNIAASAHRLWQTILAVVLLASANYAACASFYCSRWTECLILISVFGAGSWRLLSLSREPAGMEAMETVETVEAVA